MIKILPCESDILKPFKEMIILLHSKFKTMQQLYVPGVKIQNSGIKKKQKKHDSHYLTTVHLILLYSLEHERPICVFTPQMTTCGKGMVM